MEAPAPLTVAAIDLGSNSFHMILGRTEGHDLQIVDRLKETVRLAAGLDEHGEIGPEAFERALACLQRFGQRLQALPEPRVRAVGTNTLRRAANARRFRLRAREALGHSVEVISGAEEARLIYLGVAHSLAADPRARLVVDIGGGSTELIVGRGFDVLAAHSLSLGCVSFSERFFAGGGLTPERFRAAETAARLELEGIAPGLADLAWKTAVGSSGTVHALAALMPVVGGETSRITREGLKKLRKHLVGLGSVDALDLPGLSESRRPVLAGGLAVLLACAKALGIDSLEPSPGALREGVLYDLLGRIRHEDVRHRTIGRMMDQYRADPAQAARVEQTALHLLNQVAAAWDLDAEKGRLYLGWAARLHEIGLAVSHGGFHRHGAYLVYHTEMPGFARDDQVLLACLLQNMRGKIRRHLFEELLPRRVEPALKLCLLLRLALRLNRSRTAAERPDLELEGRTLRLGVSPAWEDAHPLTRTDLEREARRWKPLEWKLELAPRPGAEAKEDEEA